ncbi:MAG: lysine--tRNA ligase [Mycoplasmataceae bacterium]|nr:lysine--tRNA ligase [Mycoplasmataceae bacterium]
MANEYNEQELVKRSKLKALREKGIDPFLTQKFIRNYDSESYKDAYSKYTKEELHENTDQIIVAGRIMAIRQTFGVIKDFTGKVQFYINKKTIDPETWELFNDYIDIGDIVGIEGTPMKTNTGEITVKVKKLILLSKSLKPLPEKFHGLVDEEERARRRYVDLFMNDESLKTFVTRSKIMTQIRNYMDSNGFFEVETPVLQPVLGGASARPFVTHHNTLDRNYYLRIAPELALKKLIVGGFEKVYEIGRVFRNEGMDATHNPEFTTIEAYQAYVSMEEIMTLTENIIRNVAESLNQLKFTYKGVELDFSKPFIKKNMVDFIKEETGVDFNEIQDDAGAIKVAKEHKISLQGHQQNRGHIINAFFEEYCEKKCLEPTFVYGHPVEVSPLAKKNQKDPRYTDRFELFILGKEYANAFSELNDPIDQKERFESQLKEKDLGNEEASEMDDDFIEALEYGLPPTGGLGIGLDRLAMLFTNNETIRNVLLFPHMRDEK